MLSGSSGMNHMLYARGYPHDYDSWAALVNDTSWSYDAILPYLKKSERLTDREILNSEYGKYHGSEGRIGVTKQKSKGSDKYFEAFREIGYQTVLDINSPASIGFTFPTFTLADGVRQETARAYLTPTKYCKNLHVLKNTLVTKIIFDENKAAVAVEAMLENKKIITIRAKKEIIVSAGAINSPQLLMLSGIGPKEHLESMGIDIVVDLPVGRNMQDHIITIMSFKMQKSEAPPPPPRDPGKYPSDMILGAVSLNMTQKYPDYLIASFITPHDSVAPLSSCAFFFGLRDEVRQNLHDAGKGRDTLISTLFLLHPKSRGKVLLCSTNPIDPPLIYPGYYTKDEDVDTMAKYLEDFTRVGNSSFFRSVSAELVDFGIPECAGLELGNREYWRCYAKGTTAPGSHYTGTCAQGTVVDSRLRVKGVKRLRVADASIIPVHISGTTNPATIMVGEKGADIIKENNK